MTNETLHLTLAAVIGRGQRVLAAAGVHPEIDRQIRLAGYAGRRMLQALEAGDTECAQLCLRDAAHCVEHAEALAVADGVNINTTIKWRPGMEQQVAQVRKAIAAYLATEDDSNSLASIAAADELVNVVSALLDGLTTARS